MFKNLVYMIFQNYLCQLDIRDIISFKGLKEDMYKGLVLAKQNLKKIDYKFTWQFTMSPT